MGIPGRPGPLVLAHRGDHRRTVENTLAAFRSALAAPGCDGLEFDVRLSADGVPVVLHDETVARIHGRPGRAAELGAEELAGLGIPSLAEVLRAAPAPAFLDVELKIDTGPAAVEVLRAARGPRLGRAVVSSFDVVALETVRALEPGWPCWLNAVDLAPATIELAVRLGCLGISADWRAIDERAARRVDRAGLILAAWTVTRRPTLARLARLGVAAVCVEGAALTG